MDLFAIKLFALQLGPGRLCWDSFGVVAYIFVPFDWQLKYGKYSHVSIEPRSPRGLVRSTFSYQDQAIYMNAYRIHLPTHAVRER